MTEFYLFGGITVVASLLVIAQRNPIHSVLLLIASFGALSGLYVLLDAPFVAVTQIIVYAGAIMVLFLFVVMLLNAPQEETEPDAKAHVGRRADGVRYAALLAVGLVAELVWVLSRGGGPARLAPAAVSSVAVIGRSLFTDYAFQFEVTSVLILVAMIGAVVLARRDDAVRGRPRFAGESGVAVPRAGGPRRDEPGTAAAGEIDSAHAASPEQVGVGRP